MHKYTLNAVTGTIHIYEGLHYNPIYRNVEKSFSCNDLPSYERARDLGKCASPQLAWVKARKRCPTADLHFCQKCFGSCAVVLDAYV